MARARSACSRGTDDSQSPKRSRIAQACILALPNVAVHTDAIAGLSRDKEAKVVLIHASNYAFVHTR